MSDGRCFSCNCVVCKCSRNPDLRVEMAPAMITTMLEENSRFKLALREIRSVAANSEGTEFYAMLADKALKSEV